MIQVQRGTSNTIRAAFVDGETPVTAVTATLGIVASDGTEVVAPGTSASAGTNEWTHLLAPVAECDRLTATWTGIDAGSNHWVTVQTIEVVGGFYFSLQDLRSMPDIKDDTDTYTTSLLVLARQWIETLIERTVGTSFVERFHQEIQPAPSSRSVDLWTNDPYPVRLLGISLDGTSVVTGDLSTLTFHLDRILPSQNHVWPSPFGLAWTSATIRYVAAFSTEAPEDLRVAALQAARNRLLSVDGDSGIPDRARSISNQFGNISLATAGGDDHPTGIDEVDSVICGWREKVRILAFA